MMQQNQAAAAWIDSSAAGTFWQTPMPTRECNMAGVGVGANER